MSNLNIWDKAKHIDVKHLKPATVNGNSCTTVNGLEMVRIATEVLGPIGKNWWYEIAEERMDETKPMPNFEPHMELLHTVKLRLHVNHGDGWQYYEQYGHTKARYLAGARKPNPYIAFDEEYAKKSVTDALKKCLSLLGVAADVYTGMIDDHAYMEEVQAKQEIKRADSSSEERAKSIDEIKAKTEDALAVIEKLEDKAAALRSISTHRTWLSHRTQSRELAKAANHGLLKIENALNEKYGE